MQNYDFYHRLVHVTRLLSAKVYRALDIYSPQNYSLSLSQSLRNFQIDTHSLTPIHLVSEADVLTKGELLTKITANNGGNSH